MSAYTDYDERLNDSLALTIRPVAITMVDEAPPGHQKPDTKVSAGCQFWESGARSALVTTASDHRHCSIGIHTHNLADAPTTQSEELMTTLAAMQGLDYVRESEVAAIPVVSSSSAMVAYTPLSECTSEPDVVMIFANAAQGLVITEAIARVDGEVPSALGRPACALVPAVMNAGRGASSLGCCGARAYIDSLDDDITLWALPGSKLEACVREIETLSKANTMLQQFHHLRRAEIEAGGDPTVSDSLARLQDG